MECNQYRPGFELVSPCSFPTAITTTPRAPPRAQRHNDKERAKTSLENIYLSTYLQGSKGLCGVLLWEGVGDQTELQYIDPHSYGRLRSPGLLNGRPSRPPLLLNGRPKGSALSWMMAFFTASYHQLVSKATSGVPRAPSAWRGFPYHISSLTPTVWLLVLTELYNSSMPTQSPTQSLEWHVWLSSSGNNCHVVHRSLSSGASAYECTMGFFYLVSFHQPNPPMWSLSITGHSDVSLPSGASLWNGMFSRAEGQNTTHTHQ